MTYYKEHREVSVKTDTASYIKMNGTIKKPFVFLKFACIFTLVVL